MTNPCDVISLYIKGYIKDTDFDKTKQFSATTFINLDKKGDKFILVSFRGTDGSYVGWKEDFEMSYKDMKKMLTMILEINTK